MHPENARREEIIERLRRIRKSVVSLFDERLLSSMCFPPHEIAIEAYRMFMDVNYGDKGLAGELVELEQEVIEMLGELYGNEETAGMILSGGTEANLVAVWAMRELAGNPRDCNLVVPETAHFSFEKISRIMGIELRFARVDERFKVVPESIAELVDDRTIGIVAIAGTSEYGSIDEIEEIARIASEEDIPLHVDAAYGGLMIPFLLEEGFDLPRLRFYDGVLSISTDPHKFGRAVIPSGAIVFRDEDALRKLEVDSPYLLSKKHRSFLGTRPGAAIAATWAVMKLLWRDGYKKMALRAIELTRYLVNRCKEFGIEPAIDPELNIVALDLGSRDVAGRSICRMRELGWLVSTTRRGFLRVVVLPTNQDESILDRFVSDLLSTLEVGDDVEKTEGILQKHPDSQEGRV